MSFAPLDSEILFSTTIKQGPMVFAVWCAILASKDEMGVTALNPETLVGLMSDPLEGRIADYGAIKAAWEVLAAPDPKSKTQEFEGRRIIPSGDGRWVVVNHEKYRIKHQREVRKIQLLVAKQKQRRKEKQGVCEVEGCGEPAETAVEGRLFCLAHEPVRRYVSTELADDDAPI